MWAIQTKYLGPTDHKGGRVKAWFGERGQGLPGLAKPRSVTIGWRDELNVHSNHMLAAELLRRLMVDAGRWGGCYVKAKLLGADVAKGMVFVFSETEEV